MKKKKVLFGSDAKNQLLAGINIAANAVKSTHGARGRTVLIESEHHTGGITATKDGVTVLSLIHLKDNVQNLGVLLIRQAATKTVRIAGDGTTTATCLVAAIVNKANELIGSHNNVVEIAKTIEKISEIIIEHLEKASIPVDDHIIRDVATVSANNDEVIGGVIADAYLAVGENGVVLAEFSKDHKTYFETSNGMRISRGLISQFHITNTKNISCELESPYVLVTDLKITSARDIEPMMKLASGSDRPLFIIGELEPEAQATIDKNIMSGNLKSCTIIPPQFGIKREEMMSDIAKAVGAKYITRKVGNDWSSIDTSYLGQAERVVVTRTDTTISLGLTESDPRQVEISKLISDLQGLIPTESDESEIENINARIANLSGKIATVFVGGKTDVEQKEKYDRVDDSIKATKAAISKGILPGGGIAYIDAIRRPVSIESVVSEKSMNDEQIAEEIMMYALAEPFKQILSNAGKDPVMVYNQIESAPNFGYDVSKEIYGDMVEMGIIDATKVVTSALSNAVSAAVTIMMTSTVIANENNQEDDQQ